MFPCLQHRHQYPKRSGDKSASNQPYRGNLQVRQGQLHFRTVHAVSPHEFLGQFMLGMNYGGFSNNSMHKLGKSSTGTLSHQIEGQDITSRQDQLTSEASCCARCAAGRCQQRRGNRGAHESCQNRVWACGHPGQQCGLLYVPACRRYDRSRCDH